MAGSAHNTLSRFTAKMRMKGTQTAPSLEPVAKELPSLLNCRRMTFSEWPCPRKISAGAGKDFQASGLSADRQSSTILGAVLQTKLWAAALKISQLQT